MEPSRELEICEQRRRILQDQLSELQRCWKALGVIFEQRELEEIKTHESLQECLQKKNVVDKQHAELVAAINGVQSSWLRSMNNREVLEGNRRLFDTVETLRKTVEDKTTDLQTTENKVEELSEMKNSLAMQLSELRHRCRAKRGEHSTSASAKGN